VSQTTAHRGWVPTADVEVWRWRLMQLRPERNEKLSYEALKMGKMVQRLPEHQPKLSPQPLNTIKEHNH
jgi:hypothetical protein